MVVLTAINCDRKVFVSLYCHRIQAVIGVANRIVTDKHIRGLSSQESVGFDSGEGIRYNIPHTW